MADTLEQSCWSGLEADLFALVSQALPTSTYRALFMVCKSWNRALKQRMDKMQVAWRLGGPHAVEAGSCNLQRWFPALQNLDLSAQRLQADGIALQSMDGTQPVSGMQHALRAATALQSLDIAHCKVTLDELVFMISGMQELRHLCLAGLQVADYLLLPATRNRFFAALSSLPLLCSLDLSVAQGGGSSSGFALTGRCSSLLPLHSLTSLNLGREHLDASDMACIGQLTGLSSLALDWYGRDADIRLGLSGAAWQHLLHLTRLTSLRVVMFGRRGLFQESGLSVAPLSRLCQLGLSGCCDHRLVLSIMHLGASLRQLDLSCAWLTVTPELVVQVCSRLPQLVALDVSHSHWGGSYGQFALPGDVLLSGLSAVCPQLVALHMQGVEVHGTGLRPGASGALGLGPPGLPQLQVLLLSGGLLLKSRLRELGLLQGLRRLTLTRVPPEEFLAASKVGGYLALSSLTALTTLQILAPRPTTSPHAAAQALQPGPLPHDLAAEEGEPMEDGWVQIEHQAPGQPPQQQQVAANEPAWQLGAMEPFQPGSSSYSVRLSPPPQEPHLLFASCLGSLQVLVLTALDTSGFCFRHLTGLHSLRVLHLGGEVHFTSEGLAAVRCMSLPSLQSLQLMTCSFSHELASDAHAGQWRSTMADMQCEANIRTSRMSLSEGSMQQQQQQPCEASSSRHSALAQASGGPSHVDEPSPEDVGAGCLGLRQLLVSLALALPNLEHLELGDCYGLTGSSLGRALALLPRLRYLVLHAQPLAESACVALLGPASQLQFFASWPGSVRQQVAAGVVPVPGSGRGHGSSGGGGPWPACEVGPAAAQPEVLPGAGFFAECPLSSPDLLGPRGKQGGFMLTRMGGAMVRHAVPEAA